MAVGRTFILPYSDSSSGFRKVMFYPIRRILRWSLECHCYFIRRVRRKAIFYPIRRVRRWPLECHFYFIRRVRRWPLEGQFLPHPESSLEGHLPYPLYCRFLRIITYAPIEIAQSLLFSSSLNNLSNFTKLLYQYMYNVTTFSPLITSCLTHLG